ncbi:MAG: excinuclease ABC subunit UvrC [Methanomicrobiaceae archaeon]|nr:excinuclease ABC subunit UvrC [Methanomicrobiaceae archaeon]
MIDPDRLPQEPGCYLFYDDHGTVLYVGKAKNLQKRVASYLHEKKTNTKTTRLLGSAGSVDFIVTDSEVEALILENTLIKRHQPRFNINLKDAKSYAYIHLSDEPFPRIGIARSARGKGKFFGPMVSARERDYILQAVKRIFGLRSCRRMPRRACLRYHIGSCSAPCIGKVTAERYHDLVARAETVLRGNAKELVREMKGEMATRSSGREYELAMELRDQIAALEHLTPHQRVARRREHNEDVIGYVESGEEVHLIVFNIEKGTLSEKQEFRFPAHGGFFEEFIVQFYGENEPPRELIVPHPVGEAVEEFLSRQKGRRVTVTVPVRGEKRKLLELAQKNIEAMLRGGKERLEDLQRRLHLPDPPAVIECFDISHLSGTAMVGSMVQFRDGRPDRRNYRRFRIKTVEQVDDYAAIAEVVGRRYRRLLSEGRELPDLIIIDGGRGQLSAATRTLAELGAKIPVISIAKEQEEVFVPGMRHPLPIGRREAASLFIQEIRDEAHRFAVSYHRLLRKKGMIP